MKSISLLFLVLSIFAVVYSSPLDSYSKYDDFDVDTVLNNQRILKNYVKCMLDKGPCTSEGKDFRRLLPEIMETTCSKCTPHQKRMMKKLTIHLKAKQAQDWQKILEKFDKDAKYRKNFDKFISETE